MHAAIAFRCCNERENLKREWNILELINSSTSGQPVDLANISVTMTDEVNNENVRTITDNVFTVYTFTTISLKRICPK